jgi:DNA-binding CsgD family transcriptional regulator
MSGTPPPVQLLLDRLFFGVLVLDAEARVLSANAAALRMVAARDALEIVNGTLRALRVRDQLRLQALLDAAIARGVSPALGEATLTLDRASGAPPYLLHAVADAAEPTPAVRLWLLIVDPQRAPTPAAATLMQAFGLTQCEAQLALALAAGDTLSEHAHRRGISVGTARRHLERTLRKTRVGRQAELVRLTLALTLPVSG